MIEKDFLEIEKMLQEQERKALIVHKKTGSILPLIALQDQIEAFHDELEMKKNKET